ncbi:triacylglycerol lipase OBL1-like [Impatiens glandulifera]|uniref:triacylglycerol lipase OBL1-like n=1 Tax=Impatiens glandulifera TaxID=253017 RepID=UPI001FB0E9E7|nr:triacylglycerol lipase OBL1-like [Impatiens glandulifera]
MVMSAEEDHHSPDCDNTCLSDEYMRLEPNEVTFIDLFKFLFLKDNKKWEFIKTESLKKDKINPFDYPNEEPKFIDHKENNKKKQSSKPFEYRWIVFVCIFIQKLLLFDSKPFKYRWIVFVCIFIQKLLQFVSKPLSWAGSKFEMWLNICSRNGNISGLLLKLLRWEIIEIPETDSENYFSFIGCLDKRMELPNHIKHGDPTYYSSIAVMASKLSYENQSHVKKIVTDFWKMEFKGFYDFWNDYQDKPTTQAFIFINKNVEPELTVVAFRGTETFDADAWCTDLDLSWFDLEKIMGKGTGKAHCGFMKALGAKKGQGWPENIEEEKGEVLKKLAYYEIRKILKEVFRENDKGRFIVTGHSLGGALAVLFPAILSHHNEKDLLKRMEGVYTFGQPRVGDEEFGNFMTKMFREHEIGYHRFVYGNDIVPRLPYDDTTLMFKHFGSCILFDSSYIGDVVDDEPNKNYFSRKWFWKKIKIACKELKRSFTIAREKSDDYKEGWMLMFIRMVGLVCPGFSAHSLRDYDNSVRLGLDDVFSRHKHKLCHYN